MKRFIEMVYGLGLEFWTVVGFWILGLVGVVMIIGAM